MLGSSPVSPGPWPYLPPKSSFSARKSHSLTVPSLCLPVCADFHFPKQGKKAQILDNFIRRCAGLEPVPAPSVPLEWKQAWCSWGNVTSCTRQADAWLRLRRPSPHAPFKVLHAVQTGASSQPHAPQSGPNKRYGTGIHAVLFRLLSKESEC